MYSKTIYNHLAKPATTLVRMNTHTTTQYTPYQIIREARDLQLSQHDWPSRVREVDHKKGIDLAKCDQVAAILDEANGKNSLSRSKAGDLTNLTGGMGDQGVRGGCGGVRGEL